MPELALDGGDVAGALQIRLPTAWRAACAETGLARLVVVPSPS
jgi:hypothetical protein